MKIDISSGIFHKVTVKENQSGLITSTHFVFASYKLRSEHMMIAKQERAWDSEWTQGAMTKWNGGWSMFQYVRARTRLCFHWGGVLPENSSSLKLCEAACSEMVVEQDLNISRLLKNTKCWQSFRIKSTRMSLVYINLENFILESYLMWLQLRGKL